MNYNAIAIAGLPCSGKTTLVEALARQLGWDTHSIGGLLRERHKDWQQQSQQNEQINFEQYFREHVTNEDIFKVNDDARELLRQGNIILDSRYVAVNAHELPSVFRVFLEAPLDVRAKRIQKKNPGVPTEEIIFGERGLATREADEVIRGQIYTPMFDSFFDYRDTKHYRNNDGEPFIIDTSEMSVDEEVEKILASIGFVSV